MATFTYTKIADYILDQFWGFASANALKNSLRYIGEDVLGDPSANTDKVNAAAYTAASANASWQTYTRPSGSSPGVRGVAISSASSAGANTSSTSYSDVTNMSCTLVTTGRPVFLTLIGDTTAGGVGIVLSKVGSTSQSTLQGHMKLVRDSTDIYIPYFQFTYPSDTSGAHSVGISPGSVNFIDVVGAGTYTYKVQFKVSFTDNNLAVFNSFLAAFEL